MATKTSAWTVPGLMALVIVGLLSLGGETPMEKRYEMAVPDYATTPAARADEMTNELLGAYNRTVDDLIRQIREGKNLSNYAKCQIIYLLGSMRALSATTVLIENIDFRAESMDPADRIARWGPYPAREALIKIGPYASGMIMGITGSDTFDEAKVDGYAAVLAEIETPRYALMRLRDRLGKTEEEAARRQYEIVIARIEATASPSK